MWSKIQHSTWFFLLLIAAVMACAAGVQFFIFGRTPTDLWNRFIEHSAWECFWVAPVVILGWEALHNKIKRLQTCSEVNFEAGELNYQRLEARIERLDTEINERLHNIEDALAEIKNTISQR